VLRKRLVPQSEKLPTVSEFWSRSQSALASTHDYPRLWEDAAEGYGKNPLESAITNHRRVEDLRARKWEKADQNVTSAFFLVWAVGVALLGGWHAANQLSASVVQVAVAVLTASCAPMVFSRMNRQTPDGVHCVEG